MYLIPDTYSVKSCNHAKYIGSFSSILVHLNIALTILINAVVNRCILRQCNQHRMSSNQLLEVVIK